MPQFTSPGGEAGLKNRAPLRIAQGETRSEGHDEGAPRQAGAHTAAQGGTEHGKHQAGEIPHPHLLLWNSLLVTLLLLAFAVTARRGLSKVPRGLANFAELVAEWLKDMTVGIIGPGGERYLWLTGTVFLYILTMNLIGLIPGLHSPTSNLTFTFALGLVVFLYVQFEGIRQNGLGGYLKHFAGPMPAMAPLIGLVEIISELVKPFTLAIRLFGNIFGEDVILGVLAGLGGAMLSLPFLPLQAPILLLALLTALVQAMVFFILTCIYIALMASHDHDEHGEHSEEALLAH